MKALLVVDLQKDFCPGGSLPAPDGDIIVPVVNKLMGSGVYAWKIAAREDHPRNHGSFASQHPGHAVYTMGELNGRPQMLWPDHCVSGTHGAEFHDELCVHLFDYIQFKGQDPAVDSYSAFKDNAGVPTGLHTYVLEKGITELDVCGLVTEYCVMFSALDGASLLPGVRVRLISDASRCITEQASRESIAKMQAAGIASITSDEALAA